MKTLSPSQAPISPLARTIRRWRWVAVTAAILVAVGLEGMERHSTLDGELWWELGLGALVLPAAIWLGLTRLAGDVDQRTRQQVLQEQRRQFVHGLAKCSDWEEVAEFIVGTLPQLAPAQRVALLMYDVASARLQLARVWPVPDPADGSSAPVSTALCHTCQLARLRHVSRCEHQPEAGADGQRLIEDYCVPLAHDSLLLGLVRLHCAADQPLSEDQREILTSLAPEIALAVVRMLGLRGQVAQARTSAQLYERREIAQILHNSLAHQIGYLQLSLAHLAEDQRLAALGDIPEELRQMRDVAGEAYDRIRDTLTFLRSQEQADLAGTVAELVKTVKQEAGLEVIVSTQGDPRALPPPLSRVTARLVQEGLHNIVKHAHAQRVEVSLRWHADTLEVHVTDDGVGFDAAAGPARGHYGLLMLRETIAELGGAVRVESAPGCGTHLICSVPLAEPAGPPQEK